MDAWMDGWMDGCIDGLMHATTPHVAKKLLLFETWPGCVFAADLMSEQHMKNIRWHFRIVYLYI